MKNNLKTFPNHVSNIHQYRRWKEDFEAKLRKKLYNLALNRDTEFAKGIRVACEEVLGE